MSPHSFLIHAVCYGAALLGGVCLFAGAFVEKGRQAAHWIRLALWFCGTACVLWGLVGFVILYAEGALSASTLVLLGQAKTLLSGIGIGMLILLFASGEFVSAFSSKPKESSIP